jgi:hypothetical protein
VRFTPPWVGPDIDDQEYLREIESKKAGSNSHDFKPDFTLSVLPENMNDLYFTPPETGFSLNLKPYFLL